jgi:hypothetical protein
VLPLVEPLIDKEHRLLMANFHNAPALAIKLKCIKIDFVGTLHLKEKDVQKLVKERGKYGSAFWPSVCAEML